jgi:hypothetical protein
MERACGRVYFIDGMFYLYNGITGNNDGYINYSAQIDVVYKVKRKPKLECLPEYKKLPLYYWKWFSIINFIKMIYLNIWQPHTDKSIDQKLFTEQC